MADGNWHQLGSGQGHKKDREFRIPSLSMIPQRRRSYVQRRLVPFDGACPTTTTTSTHSESIVPRQAQGSSIDIDSVTTRNESAATDISIITTGTHFQPLFARYANKLRF